MLAFVLSIINVNSDQAVDCAGGRSDRIWVVPWSHDDSRSNGCNRYVPFRLGFHRYVQVEPPKARIRANVFVWCCRPSIYNAITRPWIFHHLGQKQEDRARKSPFGSASEDWTCGEHVRVLFIRYFVSINTRAPMFDWWNTNVMVSFSSQAPSLTDSSTSDRWLQLSKFCAE